MKTWQVRGHVEDVRDVQRLQESEVLGCFETPEIKSRFDKTDLFHYHRAR